MSETKITELDLKDSKRFVGEGLGAPEAVISGPPVRKLQIGVMGSAQDLNYGKRLEELAEEVGMWIAKSGSILVFGAEKDYDSLSTAACRGAKREGGLTMGVTYGRGKDIYQKDADIIVVSGMERGGGREFVLSASSDCLHCFERWLWNFERIGCSLSA